MWAVGVASYSLVDAINHSCLICNAVPLTDVINVFIMIPILMVFVLDHRTGSVPVSHLSLLDAGRAQARSNCTL